MHSINMCGSRLDSSATPAAALSQSVKRNFDCIAMCALRQSTRGKQYGNALISKLGTETMVHVGICRSATFVRKGRGAMTSAMTAIVAIAWYKSYTLVPTLHILVPHHGG